MFNDGGINMCKLLKNGRPGRTRTSDLFRVNLSWLGITTSYRTAGTAKTPESRTRQPVVWVGLWVGKTIDLIRGGLAGPAQCHTAGLPARFRRHSPQCSHKEPPSVPQQRT